MDSTHSNLVALLKAAIKAAIDSKAAARDDDALETLDLAQLRELASKPDAGLEALRRYLVVLGGDVRSHAAAAMVVLSNHAGNAEPLGAGKSTVIASILPSSPTDDELAGKA